MTLQCLQVQINKNRFQIVKQKKQIETVGLTRWDTKSLLCYKKKEVKDKNRWSAENKTVIFQWRSVLWWTDFTAAARFHDTASSYRDVVTSYGVLQADSSARRCLSGVMCTCGAGLRFVWSAICARRTPFRQIKQLIQKIAELIRPIKKTSSRAHKVTVSTFRSGSH